MTSNAAPPRVRSLGIGPGGGVVKGGAVNRLQPQHVDLTDVTSLPSFGIQYFSSCPGYRQSFKEGESGVALDDAS